MSERPNPQAIVSKHAGTPHPSNTKQGREMRVYDSAADGFADAMALSAAMTRKLAVAGLPFGGGKAVLAVREIPYGERRHRILHRYGELRILYAPDYVINAGGSLHGIGLAALGWSADELDHALNRIGETLTEIYRTADEEGIATSAAADRLAAAKLTRATSSAWMSTAGDALTCARVDPVVGRGNAGSLDMQTKEDKR